MVVAGRLWNSTDGFNDWRVEREESQGHRTRWHKTLKRPETGRSSREKSTEGQMPASHLDGEEELFQSSSGFMRHAVSAAGQGSGYTLLDPLPATHERVVPNMVGFFVDSADPTFATFDHQAIVLPLEKFADTLIEWYWLHVQSLWPILHRPTFEAQYSKLWGSSAHSPYGSHGFEELVFHATLNVVLALGCQRNESMTLAQREYQAEEFYRRSQRLISIETLDGSSLSVVQLLLLRTLYLYFSARANRSWLMLGAAIRVAIGEQLHASGPKNAAVTQLEREMRRRVWWAGCVTIDLILATVFGRPPMIYKQIIQVPLPLSIDDEFLSTTAKDAAQPEGIPSRIHVVMYSLKAAPIVEDMRALVIGPRSNHSAEGSLGSSEPIGPDPSAVLRVDSRIDDYLDNFPEHLQAGTDLTSMNVSEEDKAIFKFQGQALRSRAFLLKLLLLRPSLLAEVRRWTSSTPPSVRSSAAKIEERLHKELCSLCLSTAHAVLEEMHSTLYTAAEAPAWYALQNAFSAALILVAATLAPTLGVDFAVDPARSSWERAIRIMERHKSHVASAERGIDVIQRFRKYIASRVAERERKSPDLPAQMPPPTPPNPGQSIFNATTSALTAQLHAQFNDGAYSQPYGIAQQGNPPEPMDHPMRNFSEILGENALDQSWITMQDFGQDDWMLHY
ncbi:hypothetical protein OQA88_862 [Cercophora sp. LCS_1]